MASVPDTLGPPRTPPTAAACSTQLLNAEGFAGTWPCAFTLGGLKDGDFICSEIPPFAEGYPHLLWDGLLPPLSVWHGSEGIRAPTDKGGPPDMGTCRHRCPQAVPSKADPHLPHRETESFPPSDKGLAKHTAILFLMLLDSLLGDHPLQ